MADEALSRPYNFVIVGGGTAGLTLAARLTEDPSISVLVLEAGESRHNDPKIDIPAFMSQLYDDPNYNWGFKTTPQPGLNNRIIAQPLGKVLGGSSAINFMMVSHATKNDIDNWGELGNIGWDYETLSPYYRKFETYHVPDKARVADLGADIIDPSLYGSSGPVQITFPHATGPLDHAWRPTFLELSLGARDDARRGATLGAYSVLRSIDQGGKRSTAASAFYYPNASRANLTLLTSAHVEKIIFDSKKVNNQAVATDILFSVRGQEYIVPVAGEVILSAGTFLSPKILELSGIGSKKILESNSIPVVAENSNVGENLQDHMLVPLLFDVVDGMATAESIKQPGVLEWALNEWQTGRGGPLASGVSGTGFLSHAGIIPHINEATTIETVTRNIGDSSTVDGLAKQVQIQKRVFLDEKEADLQFNFAATGFSVYNTSERLGTLFQHNDPGNYAGGVVAQTHPFSRGSSHINGPDPKLPPTIDPKYLSNPADLELLADGILLLQKIFETGPMGELIRDRPNGDGKSFQPSMRIESRINKVKALELVKDIGISSWHPIGTCSMLPQADGGVVDTHLKVYGTINLRVVDASIIPLHVRGNIQTAVYAIAERAADIIKDEYRK
ncbi:hypothetical protein B7463_g9199, partial [Scytalidium lignicola]